jgi:hypothetical protein
LSGSDIDQCNEVTSAHDAAKGLLATGVLAICNLALFMGAIRSHIRLNAEVSVMTDDARTGISTSITMATLCPEWITGSDVDNSP